MYLSVVFSTLRKDGEVESSVKVGISNLAMQYTMRSQDITQSEVQYSKKLHIRTENLKSC